MAEVTALLTLLLFMTPLIVSDDRLGMACLISAVCSGHWLLFFMLEKYTHFNAEYSVFAASCVAAVIVIKGLKNSKVITIQNRRLQFLCVVLVAINIGGFFLHFLKLDMLLYIVSDWILYVAVFCCLMDDMINGDDKRRRELDSGKPMAATNTNRYIVRMVKGQV